MRWSRPLCRWSTAVRAGWSTACSARFFGGPAADGHAAPPGAVEQRWRAAWGDDVVDGGAALRSRRGRRSISASPMTRRRPLPRSTAASRSPPTCPAAGAGSVTDLPGFGDGRLVGAGSCRLAARAIDPAERARGARPVRRAGRQDDAACGRRAHGSPPSTDRKVRLKRLSRESGSDRAEGRSWSPPTPRHGQPDAPVRAILLDAPCSATGTFRRHPEVLYRARPRIIDESAELQARLLDTRRRMVEAGRSARLFGLLARARGRRSDRCAAFLEQQPRRHRSRRRRRANCLAS